MPRSSHGDRLADIPLAPHKMSQPSNILVLGTGELGTAALASLAAHPQRGAIDISVTMRPSSLASPTPSKQAELARLQALAITPVPLDLESAAHSTLVSTFARYELIISCTGMAAPPSFQLRLARAVLAAKTPRYIPWQFGVDYDVIGPDAAGGLFRTQCEVRALLRSQEVTRWVIVSTGVFMSFLFERTFGVVEGAGDNVVTRAFGDWGNGITATTVEDIGKCTAEVVFDEGVWKEGSGNGGVVHIAGDTLTFEDVAELMKNVLGRSVRRELWSTEELVRRMAEKPEDVIHKYRMIWAENQGVAWDVRESFNGRRGISMTSAEEWAKEHLRL